MLNKEIEDSISLSINGKKHDISFDIVDNYRVYIRAEVNQSYEKPNITVHFSEEVFYNELLLSLDDLN